MLFHDVWVDLRRQTYRIKRGRPRHEFSPFNLTSIGFPSAQRLPSALCMRAEPLLNNIRSQLLMAEKRKQPPRAGREPAAKKRASEAAATPTSNKKKEKAPTPKAPTPLPEPVEAPLPAIVKEGDPLPIRKARQPINLSDEDYQSIAERYDALKSLVLVAERLTRLVVLVRCSLYPLNGPRRNGSATESSFDITRNQRRQKEN